MKITPILTRIFILVMLGMVLGTVSPVHSAPGGGSLIPNEEPQRDESTEWFLEIIDGSNDTGFHVSLDIAPKTGRIYISYYDASYDDLRMASYYPGGGRNCGEDGDWKCETVDSEGDVGQYSSLAINPVTDLPAIAYYDASNNALKYASYSCYGPCIWRVMTIRSQDPPIDLGQYGLYASLKIDSRGIPHIASYAPSIRFPDALMYATYVVSGGNCGEGLAAGQWQCSFIYTAEGLGRYASLDLSYDSPHIAFAGVSGVLTNAYKGGSNPNCGPGNNTWTCKYIDDANYDTGYYTSIHSATGIDHVAYYDLQNEYLKFAQYVGSGGNCGAGDSWQCGLVTFPGKSLTPMGVSLDLDSQRHPHIAYQDASDPYGPSTLWLAFMSDSLEANSSGKYAKNEDLQWYFSWVDKGGAHTSVGDYISMALDKENNAFIAYTEYDDYHMTHNLKLAYQDQVVVTNYFAYLPLLSR